MDNGETIIKKVHPHPLYFIGFYFCGFVFIIISFFFSWLLLILGVLVFVLGEMARRAETFYILSNGVAREYRLLSTSRESASFSKIQDIKVDQSFIDNILGIGNVHFDTAGTDETEVNFHGIRNPYEIEKIVRGKMS